MNLIIIFSFVSFVLVSTAGTAQNSHGRGASEESSDDKFLQYLREKDQRQEELQQKFLQERALGLQPGTLSGGGGLGGLGGLGGSFNSGNKGRENIQEIKEKSKERLQTTLDEFSERTTQFNEAVQANEKADRELAAILEKSQEDAREEEEKTMDKIIKSASTPSDNSAAQILQSESDGYVAEIKAFGRKVVESIFEGAKNILAQQKKPEPPKSSSLQSGQNDRLSKIRTGSVTNPLAGTTPVNGLAEAPRDGKTHSSAQ